MSWRVVTPPAEEPVELDAAKLHLRVDLDIEDSLVSGIISAARSHIELVCERALMPQTWALSLDEFPRQIKLPGGLVQEVTAITYVDPSGATQTLDPAAYRSWLAGDPPVVTPELQQDWPVTAHVPGAIEISYVVGYASADDVPAALRAALLLYAGDLYANRSAQQGVELFANPLAGRLIFPYKRVLP